MKWRNTEKDVYYFNYNSYYYYATHNSTRDPFCTRFWLSGFDNTGYLYPKKDLTSVTKLETKTLKPDSRLFFDQSSSFPRFKLSVSGNKRCIKQAKADIIVVSGDTNYHSPEGDWVILEDDAAVYLVNGDDWSMWFSANLTKFTAAVSSYRQFKGNLGITYQGRVTSYGKDTVYLAKYADGDYTLPYITDNELDKAICGMCPEPTYDEIMSVIDMLNSDDASIVQLGVKLITGFNVEKYKMTFKLILYTRSNWYHQTRNTVGTKQLIDTLGINTYYIGDNFGYNCNYIEKRGESYTAEDVALAKKVSSKLLRDWLQNMFNNSFANNNYQWLPDERRVKLE